MSQGDLLPALAEDRLEKELPDKPPMTNHEAVVEADRCLYCIDAPCIPSCPTEIDIPEFIRRIATGNVEGSAKVIFDSNILGFSCARVCPTEVLCESTCVYNEMDEAPIKIGRLQRYATDHAYREDFHPYEPGEDTGKRVALIGAGPASLACAHELRRIGHATVIFEGRPRPGGLNTNGVAPYKLQADDSLREVAWVTSIGGIDIRYDHEVGEDVTLEQLEEDFDAVFIGVGLGPDRWLTVPGQDKRRVWGAVDFIEQLKIEEGYQLPDDVETIAVIGGGNTALDVVRETRKLGVEDVMLVYRRDEETMSGYAHEWDRAKREGARGVWWSQPVEILGDERATGVRCRRTRITHDSNDREVFEEIEGSEFDIAADLIVLAIGQSKLGEMFEDIDGIETEWGRIVTDEDGATGNPKYYAGGDCANGGKEVVNAAAEGKRAAHALDAFLQND